jgi:Beta-propeller repeat
MAGHGRATLHVGSDARLFPSAVGSSLAMLALVAALALVQARPLPTPSGAPIATGSAMPGSASRVSPKTRDRILDAYGKLPLTFIPNAGQVRGDARYYAQGNGFSVYFAPQKVTLALTAGKRRTALSLVPVGASAGASVIAGRPAPGRVSYFIGSRRHTDLPTYHEITYKDLWPGIDMVFGDKGGKLKYEFRLAPGADPRRINLAYEGAQGLALGPSHELLISTPLGTLRDSRPRSYQQVGSRRTAVATGYALDQRASAYGFSLAGYDRHRPLVIDPGIAYSTFIGGTGNERGIEVAADGFGNAYVTGGTYSEDFPTTTGAVDTSYQASSDAFVTKLDPTGSTVLYSTYIGGGAAESGLGIAVLGNIAYVTGGTGSSDFPTTAGAFDTSHNGNEDVWVLRLNSTGTALDYSTFIGGSSAAGDFGQAIAVDKQGNAYVTGGTGGAGFPTTTGAYDTTYNGDLLDCYVAKLNPTGTGLVYSTLLGGAGKDVGAGIAVGPSGAAYVTGDTSSSNYPTTTGAYDRTSNGKLDAFVTKVGPAGAALGYSTFLGKAADDFGKGVVVDGSGNAYVAGWTASPAFPVTAGAFDTTFGGGHDGFVTKFNAGGSTLAYSTFLGGSGTDEVNGIGIDTSANAYVTGSTDSANFPTAGTTADTTFNGVLDGFVAELGSTGASLPYSSYLGGTDYEFGRGVALGAGGGVVVTGRTNSADYPTTAGAFDTGFNGGTNDAFVTKVSPG